MQRYEYTPRIGSDVAAIFNFLSRFIADVYFLILWLVFFALAFSLFRPVSLFRLVPLNQHLRELNKSLLNIFALLGTCLDMLNPVADCKGINIFAGDLPQVLQVSLVADQQYIGIRRTLAPYLGVPVFYSIVERSLISDVVHDDQCVSA